MPDQLSYQEIYPKLEREDLDNWLQLWWLSQGGESRNQRLKMIAAMLPFESQREIAVLDLCSGPGDLGRFVREEFPSARVDCVDRDPFLLAMCTVLNRRAKIPGRTFVCDMWESSWSDELPGDYDAIVASTALHWFDALRLGEIFGDVHRLLKRGGVFLFAEPVCARPPFAAAFDKWKAKQFWDYDPGTWDQFWERANALLGYDHRAQLARRPPGRGEIGDDGIPVMEYIAMLEKSGMRQCDVLLRDAGMAVIAAAKP